MSNNYPFLLKLNDLSNTGEKNSFYLFVNYFEKSNSEFGVKSLKSSLLFKEFFYYKFSS